MFHLPPERFAIHPVSLAFRNRRLERIFRCGNIRKSLFQSRLAIVLGLSLYVLFALLDLVLLGNERLGLIILVRLVLIPAVFITGLVLTFTRPHWLEWVITAAILCAQAGHIVIYLAGGLPHSYLLGVTIIVMMFLMTFCRIRFRYSLIVGTVLAFSYQLTLILGGRSFYTDQLQGSFVVVSLLAVGAMAGYSIERYLRGEFKNGRQLDQERKQSNRLLLNILPRAIARELSETGITTPVRFEGVSVMFADFVNFSRLTEGCEPSKIITSLDRYFRSFDQIIAQYRLEKIKTIGDAYMVASGLPVPRPTHAVDCVLAAMDFIECVQRLAEEDEGGDLVRMDLRIGIHVGPVVAGVIGQSKFTYDIFGSTVNMASRIEASGERNRVNISRSVYEQVKDFFACENRGLVRFKHDGEAEMFYVSSIRPELALDAEGTLPGPGFIRLYDGLSSLPLPQATGTLALTGC